MKIHYLVVLSMLIDGALLADMPPSPRPRIPCSTALKHDPTPHLSIKVCAIWEEAEERFSHDPSKAEEFALKRIARLPRVKHAEIGEDKYHRFFDVKTEDGKVLRYVIKDVPSDVKITY